MTPAVENYMRERAYEIRKLRILTPDFSPPSRSVIPDVVAVKDDHTLLIECKRHSIAYAIGIGLGQVLMQREIIRMYDVELPEPIRIGMCFPDLGDCFIKYPDGYKWMSWTPRCIELTNRLAKSIGETFAVLLASTRSDKPHQDDLEPDDLNIRWIGDAGLLA